MTEDDFLTLDYLRNGSSTQLKGYDVIEQCKVLTILDKFHPSLTGTLPLDLFIEISDLDFCCEVYDNKSFAHTLILNFGMHSGFCLKNKLLNGIQSMLCRFTFRDFDFEIIGQPIPVRQQVPFRHMINEYRILQTHGENFKTRIIELKRQGMKTEPAFAHLLGLTGNPYDAMLTFTE